MQRSSIFQLAGACFLTLAVSTASASLDPASATEAEKVKSAVASEVRACSNVQGSRERLRWTRCIDQVLVTCSADHQWRTVDQIDCGQIIHDELRKMSGALLDPKGQPHLARRTDELTTFNRALVKQIEASDSLCDWPGHALSSKLDRSRLTNECRINVMGAAVFEAREFRDYLSSN